MAITLCMTCNTFNCTILFGLLESSKITLFKGLLGKIFEAKVNGLFNGFFILFSDFKLNYLQIRIFN